MKTSNKVLKKSKSNSKKKYRIKNWPQYNQALKQRGSLDIWVSDENRNVWYSSDRPKNGRPQIYSDEAIQTLLTIKIVFGLKLRQLQGFMISLSNRSAPDLQVPDYSTISRRTSSLKPKLKKKDGLEKPRAIIIDSTGVKIYGEGEWKVRQHGISKRRKWRKIHIGINEKGEVEATEMTDCNVHDAVVVPDILTNLSYTPETLSGDGAYDGGSIYDIGSAIGIKNFLIPPRKGAKIWIHGNYKKCVRYPRDETIRAIRKKGRKKWKEESGYHMRSGVENTMFRLKTITGDRLLFRRESSQRAECITKCNILNTVHALGMPQSYVVSE